MALTLLHRKDRVVLTAIEIIDQMGIQALSTREIAKRQNISEGTLFKHFKCKNEILLAVLDLYSKYDSDLIETIKMKKLPPNEAISFILETYATYYENYPAITVIPETFNILRHDPVLAEKVEEISMRPPQVIKDLIIQAHEQGLIPKRYSSEVVTDIILGSTYQVINKWRRSKYQFSLRDKISLTLEAIFNIFQSLNNEMERVK